jgi:hypothetical protein
MKLRLVQLVTIMAMAVAFGGGLAQAQAPQGCGTQSAKGGFAFRSSGTFPDGSNGLFVGTMLFDGFGKILGSNTGSIGGFVLNGSITLTYKINPDCTGSMIAAFPTGDVHWDIVIADNGKKIYGIISDQGFVFSMEATKQ